MKYNIMICALLILNLGCLYDYSVKPDYYLETGEMFSAKTSSADEEIPGTVDLETCVRLVLTNNPRIESARADSNMAQYGVDIALSYLIPKIRLEAANTFTDEDIFAFYGWDKKSMFAAKLSAQYLLYDFGIARYLLSQRYRDTDAARAGVRIVSDSLAAGAAELYFTIKAMEEDISSMSDSIRSLEARLKDTEILFEGGMIPESQVLTLKVALEELKYGKTSLENVRFKTLLSLKGLMEFPAEKPLELAPAGRNTSLTAFPSIEILLKTALERRPEITAARASMLSAEMGIKASSAMRWPLFLIGAEMGYSDLDMASLGNGGVNTQVALTMSWNVYSGGENEANVKIAREKLRKARLSLREAESKIRTEVLSAEADIRTLRGQRSSLTLAVRSARKNLEDIEFLYANQKAKSSDLVDAQASLLFAQSNLNKAEYSFLTALYALEKSIGASLETLIVPDAGDAQAQPSAEPELSQE